MQPDLPERAEDSRYMAMRQGANDLQCIGRGNKGLAAKAAADDVYEERGEVRDVAESLVLDLTVLTKGAAEQMRLIGLALVVTFRCGYMDAAIS
jgi:hypothetical protein